MTKGRNCSLDYILEKNWQNKVEVVNYDTIYVVGGLYGNYEALLEIKKMASLEKTAPLIVFNGDVHWFDVLEEDFLKVENLIRDDIKLLGNVEYELIKQNSDLGCGCNYPEDVDDGVVERSNIIHSMMKDNITNEKIISDIKTRNKTIALNCFGKKIAITHGDEKNLAGWGCSIDNLVEDERSEELFSWLKENNIDILATTHTCLPVVKKVDNNIVINNGASGMANTKNSTNGLITRISKYKNSNAVISKEIDDVYVELIKVNFDIDKFVNWFDTVWDKDSPASISYRNRIVSGTKLQEDNIDKSRATD